MLLRKIRTTLLIICLLPTFHNSYGTFPLRNYTTAIDNNLIFVPNGNQWDNSIVAKVGTKNSEVIFRNDAFLIKKKGDSLSVGIVNVFQNTNPSMHISFEKEKITQFNYLTSQGSYHVKGYGNLTYKDIYQDIDLSFYSNGTHIEYDYVLHPNAEVKNIASKLVHVSKAFIADNGSLVMINGQDSFVYESPIVYQLDSSLNRSYISCSYHLEKDILSFTLNESYDTSKDLIIDPVLDWSSYIGGGTVDDGIVTDIEVDRSGNIYATGYYTQSFPTTSGAYQPTNAGSEDVVIFKLDSSGSTVLYATYVGGLGSDKAYGIAINRNGEVYVTGETNSSNFPTTSGVYQDTIRTTSASDVFILKLNSTGDALLYSTYIGGDDPDFANDIIVDPRGNAIITGGSKSSNYPSRNAYVSNQDAFVTKLNSAGSQIITSRFAGGGSIDAGLAIAANADYSKYYFTGYTNFNFSDKFPTKTGSYNTTFTDASNDVGADGSRQLFVSCADSSLDSFYYSTYFGGRGDREYGNDIVVDLRGRAYVVGETDSDDLPVTANNIQDTLHDSTDAFVVVFNPQGTNITYCTYFGGSGMDLGYGIDIDALNTIYISGITTSNDLPLKVPYQNSLAGGSDFFYAHINRNGNRLLYSTYMGSPGSETISTDWIVTIKPKIKVDPLGRHITIGGASVSSSFPKWGWNKTNNAGLYQPLILRLSCPPNVEIFSAAESRVELCQDDTVVLDATTTGAIEYRWNTDESSPTISISNPGVYQVGIIANEDCIYIDTVLATLPPLPPLNIQPKDTSICFGQSITTRNIPATLSGPITFRWSPSIGVSDDLNYNTTLTPTDSQTFIITMTNTSNGCFLTDSIRVGVREQPFVENAGDTSLCSGDSIIYLVKNDDQIAPAVVPMPFSPVRDTTVVFTLFNQACGHDTIISRITVVQPEVINFNVDTTAIVGQDVPLSVRNTGSSYTWTPVLRIDEPSSANPIYSAEISEFIYLTFTDSNGCIASDSIFIKVDSTIQIFVSNLFTPNGDNVNDALVLHAPGFREVNLKVFNRWGNLVFEAQNAGESWDGTVDGVEQMNGNYVYVFKGTTFDGNEQIDQGVIVLVR